MANFTRMTVTINSLVVHELPAIDSIQEEPFELPESPNCSIHFLDESRSSAIPGALHTTPSHKSTHTNASRFISSTYYKQ
jgi:hypothetical protein